VKTSPPTILASALRAFFSQHLPLTRGLSPKTILSYRDAFVLLLRFLAIRHTCEVVDLDILKWTLCPGQFSAEFKLVRLLRSQRFSAAPGWGGPLR